MQKLTNTVKIISSGNYETRIDEQAPGDLGILESCVNIMAEKPRQSSDEMNPQLETKIFSKSEAIKLAAGNKKLANELTTMLICELPEHLQFINDAISKNNVEQLRQQTHKLHGATQCCGALALRNAAELLETNIDKGVFDQIESNTYHLVQEIEKLIAADSEDFMV